MEKVSFDRRRFLEFVTFFSGWVLTQKTWAIDQFLQQTESARQAQQQSAPVDALNEYVRHNSVADPGNFRFIYLNDSRRSNFLNFLANVYHLYPELEFHAMIQRAANDHLSDEEIYAEIQKGLPKIKPFLGDLFYALPSLFKQKEEISRETLEVLGMQGSGLRTVDGFLEIGSTGRYLSELRHSMSFKGDLVVLHSSAPTFSPIDVAERGQLSKLGRFCDLKGYEPISESSVFSGSIEVVANYIGFHHCPLDRLDAFVKSVVRVLKKGGSLVLRDHDVNSAEINAVVALAHDVFNAGLMVPWSTNHAELRHFRALDQWIVYLEDRGLKFQGKKILQPGDPTRNTLMEFKKV